MKRHRIFWLLLAFVLSANNIYSQMEYSIESLVNKDWHGTLPEGNLVEDSGILFTPTEVKYFFIVKNGERKEHSEPYYLSNEAEQTFNSDKVGSATTGTFIIIKGRFRNSLNSPWYTKNRIYKILSLTEEELSLLVVEKGNTVVYRLKE